MSECVVRMEMPNSCPCELAGGYDIPLPCFAGYGCPKRCKEFDECVEKGTKPDWCPFVCALPEGHGRLIDWDAFERAGFKLCRKTSECRAELGTPTNESYVVPAERSETEQV